MSDDMVERVAAAFINSFSPGAWDTMSMLTGGDAAMEPRARVLRAARAAIAAMRAMFVELNDADAVNAIDAALNETETAQEHPFAKA